MMKADCRYFNVIPCQNKLLAPYACPSQPKNQGPKYQPPLPNDTSVTMGS